jgi:uncharacterized membrane protein YvbJ
VSFCTQCGQRNTVQANFCHSCGATLDSRELHSDTRDSAPELAQELERAKQIAKARAEGGYEVRQKLAWAPIKALTTYVSALLLVMVIIIALIWVING